MIANELFDAIIRARLSGQECAVLMFVIRKTYGYSRKEASCSCQEIGDATDMKREHAYRVMKKLLHKRVTIVTQVGNRSKQTYKINKNYSEWVLCVKKTTVTQVGNRTVTQEGNKTVTQIGTNTKLHLLSLKKERNKESKINIFRFNKRVSIPKNFHLTDEMKKYAKKKEISVDLEDFTEEFILTCQANERLYRYQNWYAAWQKWLKKRIGWNKQQDKGSSRHQEEKNEPSKPVDMVAHLEN